MRNVSVLYITARQESYICNIVASPCLPALEGLNSDRDQSHYRITGDQEQHLYVITLLLNTNSRFWWGKCCYRKTNNTFHHRGDSYCIESTRSKIFSLNSLSWNFTDVVINAKSFLKIWLLFLNEKFISVNQKRDQSQSGVWRAVIDRFSG